MFQEYLPAKIIKNKLDLYIYKYILIPFVRALRSVGWVNHHYIGLMDTLADFAGDKADRTQAIIFNPILTAFPGQFGAPLSLWRRRG